MKTPRIIPTMAILATLAMGLIACDPNYKPAGMIVDGDCIDCSDLGGDTDGTIDGHDVGNGDIDCCEGTDGGDSDGDTDGGDGGDTNGGDGDTNGGDTNGGDTDGGDGGDGDTDGGDGDTNGGDTNGGDTDGGDTNGGDTDGGDGDTCDGDTGIIPDPILTVTITTTSPGLIMVQFAESGEAAVQDYIVGNNGLEIEIFNLGSRLVVRRLEDGSNVDPWVEVTTDTPGFLMWYYFDIPSAVNANEIIANPLAYCQVPEWTSNLNGHSWLFLFRSPLSR